MEALLRFDCHGDNSDEVNREEWEAVRLSVDLKLRLYYSFCEVKGVADEMITFPGLLPYRQKNRMPVP